LSSFVDFVRAPTTPVYEEADPHDQEQLLALMERCMADAAGVWGAASCLIRFDLCSPGSQ